MLNSNLPFHSLRSPLLGSALLTLLLTGCGGGSGSDSLDDVIGTSSSSSVSSSSSSVSSSSSSAGNGEDFVWEEGVFPNMDDYWSLCESPREGIAPYNGQAYPDMAGSYIDENVFLRSFSNEYYLWYDEIIDQNPIYFNTTDYFNLLVTNEKTPSGAYKDQFHWYENTDTYRTRTDSGVSVGYGMEWVLLASVPPREAVVVLTEPGSSAATAGLARGARITAIDGVDFVSDNTQAGVDVLNNALFPSSVNQSHTFTIQDLGSSTTRDVVLTATEVTVSAVHTTSVIPTPTGDVGYMLFNSHIATAESELIAAINAFETSGVSDLILDIRYNGGGYLDIASELSYMIAGSNAAGSDFYSIEFNDKYPTTDPFNGDTLQPMEFHSTTQGFSEPQGQALPALNLSRVFVLTGGNTCSASEAIMNGLAGVDVEVIQIGNPTCGKPYGAYVIDNCGLSYFTIQFKGSNAKGFGDYAGGFFPGDGSSGDASELPGCVVADDYENTLGSASEARLAAALHYRSTGSCPASSGKSTAAQNKARVTTSGDGVMFHPRGMGDMMLRD